MPGIYGFCNTEENPASTIEKIAHSMNLYPHFISDKIFYSDMIAASRVHLGHIGEKNSPTSIGKTSVWVEGEVYNLIELSYQFSFPADSTLAEALLITYGNNQLTAFLKSLDGYYCAALYDQNQEQVKLISDRYGMRMLYWYFVNGRFVWSSEVKGILSLNEIDKTIDPKSFDCFMELGYLVGEHTWFEHIKLIKPASIMTFDIKTKKLSHKYYWKWSEIKPSNLSFEQAVDVLGNCFIQAVKRRFNPSEKIGISLSGGLDSRAIFAAVNHLYPDYRGYAYTFGTPDCDDIIIAKQVIALSSWKHQIFYFSDKKWFEPRIEKIWNTDGMLDMMHMHGSEFLNEVSKHIDVNLNGYSGDAIIGGGFLPRIPLNIRANNEIIQSFFKKFSYLCDVDDDFYDIDKAEPILQMNRVRRFTAMGTVNSLVAVDQRKPFFDNQIVELIFSLPDEYRANNKIYAAMLQKFFPSYFKDIPWQKTGKPAAECKVTLSLKVINKGKNILSAVFRRKDTKNYTNYSKWICEPEIAEKLQDLLAFNSLEHTCMTHKKLGDDLISYINNNETNSANEVLRATTIKIYMEQVNSIKNILFTQ